jgi:hypothetical protein
MPNKQCGNASEGVKELDFGLKGEEKCRSVRPASVFKPHGPLATAHSGA